MTRRIPWLPLLVSLLASAGCANEPVTVELAFPSQEMFLQTEMARVMVFDLGPGSLGDCPELISDATAGSASPGLDSGNVLVCDLFDGGVQFDEIGEGPKAFVGVVSNASNVPLLDGCTVAEIYADAPRVVISLSPTPQYTTTVTGPPPYGSVADKCPGRSR